MPINKGRIRAFETNSVKNVATKNVDKVRLKEKCKKSQNSTRAPVNCRFQKKIL